MVARVLEHPATAGRDLNSIRAIGLGGAPLPPHVLALIPAVFPRAGRGTSTNYGSTEAGGIISSASGPVVVERAGTCGLPLPHVEIRLGEGEEILVRSPALMTGYWGEEQSPIDAEGWLHSGDVGRLDADGYLYIVDRIKDLIIRGGENIAAAHVELALVAHPAVAQAAVVGIPHRDLGEEVGAVVVVRPGAQLDPEQLRAHLATRLAHFEVPVHWWLRSEALPENATGKVDKRALRAAFPAADGAPPAHR
jgi:long-chain acyl-CoA synthetase